MNKKNILFLLSLILFSCQLPEIQDDWYSFKFDEIAFNDIEEVQEWVHNNIEYASDNEKNKIDYWKYPSETLDDGEGDCEDMAILIIAIIRYQLNYRCNLVNIKHGDSFHALIRYKGNYYSSTSAGRYKDNVQIVEEYEYYEIPFKISTKR